MIYLLKMWCCIVLVVYWMVTLLARAHLWPRVVCWKFGTANRFGIISDLLTGLGNSVKTEAEVVLAALDEHNNYHNIHHIIILITNGWNHHHNKNHQSHPQRDHHVIIPNLNNRTLIPLSSSKNFMTLAGEKKWHPMTSLRLKIGGGPVRLFSAA